jgi:hypothetical protein
MYSPPNNVSSPLGNGYPSQADVLVGARWSEHPADRTQRGRTRGSLRIKLDVRRARRRSTSG